MPSGWQMHAFVVADIVENVLLGVDFMRQHHATWDWLTGDLVYQGGPIVQPDNVCRLAVGQEIPPDSCSSLRVAIDPNLSGQVIHVESSVTLQPGLVVGDVISKT